MSSSTATDAGPPFDHPKAEAILRSSDGVDFRVFKLFLSLASPYFEKAFNTPARTCPDGLPIVGVNQKSATLAVVLDFCYPKWCPGTSLTTSSDIEAILAASTEFEMKSVMLQIGLTLMQPSFDSMDPLRMFAVACRYKLEDLARHAAKNSLFVPIRKRSYVAELEHITAGSLQRLQDYYHKCSEAAGAICNDSNADFPWKSTSILCTFEEGTCCGVVQHSAGHLRVWWSEFLRAASVALRRQPRGETVMRPELIVPLMAKVSLCSVCREVPLKLFLEFRKQYADEVERVISEVELELSINKPIS